MFWHESRIPASSRLWFGALRRLGRGLVGRRVELRDVAFTVASLHGCPDGARWSPGRARDVRVVLDDVETPELRARELVVECETLAVGATVTATGVTVTATMSPEALAALADDGASPQVDLVDGELRSRWLPGIQLVVRPEVAPDRLRFVPAAVLTPLGRWSWPSWLPAGTAPPPDLPYGLHLTEITTTDDGVVLRATVERWTASTRDGLRLRELLRRASHAGTAEPAGPLAA